MRPKSSRICGGIVVLSVGLALCAYAQTVPFTQSKWNRVLLVSGGPNPQYNQYAIESNARYVASLTQNAKWRRVLFADGKPESKTISTVVDNPRTHAGAVAAWILNLRAPADQTQFNAPTLRPINGPSTPDSITQNIAAFNESTDPTDLQLVYFTGHGSPGRGPNGQNDYVNTLYNSWGDNFSAQQLARELQKSKSRAPLVLVMVQCFSGGFANILYQNGDPTQPVWNRDVCGFFAAIPQRMAAGCTSQVNERDYQDFTTHFFAALSGVSRDGRKVTGADYDKNGEVSLDEAYSYAQINDDSIDVPVSTSDAYLRAVYATDTANKWQQISYDRLVKDANPSQRAVLAALGAKLKLTGQDQLVQVQKRMDSINQRPANNGNAAWAPPPGINPDQFNASYNRLEKLLKAKYPNAGLLRGAARRDALEDATNLLITQPKDLDIVYRAYAQDTSDDDNREVEEARLLRFLRVGRTIYLTQRLQREGTPDQKAVYNRLRISETRSEF